MNGAQVIVNTLIDEGTELLFGYPGGSVLPVYDALYERRDELRHILTCHEQGASHAADGYARASGRTGVVLATSGPGATNLVTGIAAAYMDSIPLVALTGNVPLRLLGRDSFQEVDIAGVTMPITKYNSIIKDPSDIEASLHEAFAIANSGRPGPVLVDIPRDIAEATADRQMERASYASQYVPINENVLKAFAHALDSAECPVILAGGGVALSGAAAALTALAERMSAPVCATLMGLGSLRWDHPLFLGLAGLHGLPEANRALRACDLLLAVGTRFTERVTGSHTDFAPRADIYHIDIDPAEIDKNIISRAHLCGPAGKILTALTELVSPRPSRARGFSAFSAQTPPPPHSPRALIRAIWQARAPGMTVVTDVGQHQMWTAQAYGFDRPDEFITSGGLGAMGFGLGAAIGAALAKPGSRVTLITGDASFHMNMSELATAVAHNLPITVFVLDNGGLGLVRQLQDELCGGRRHAVTPGWRTDWPRLAEAMGAVGFSLTEENRDAVIHKALQTDGPCVVHCPVGAEYGA